MPKSMEYGEKPTILDGIGTFEGQCNIQAIEDSVATVTFRNFGGANVVKTDLALSQYGVLYNVVKVVLTSGCVSCME